MLWHHIFTILLSFLFGAVSSSENGYIVKVQITDYENPLNIASHTRSCCDIGHNFSIPSCDEVERCDNYFSYCLRQAGTDPNDEGCDPASVIWESNDNIDGAPINFTQDVVLGLPNPFNLTGLTALWQGVQLYVTVFDRDNNNNPPDLVDTFAIDISNPIGTKRKYNTSGVAGIANINLSILVVCREFYSGDQCENVNECLKNPRSCSPNRQCMDTIDGFMCICQPGFNGSQCEENINECADVNCSGNGVCLDGLNSYSCDCNEGYWGESCESIDHCLNVNCSEKGHCVQQDNNFTCICQEGFTGKLCNRNITETEIPTTELPLNENLIIVGALAGALVGMILLIIVVIICGILCKEKYKARQAMFESNLDPVYETVDAVDSNRMMDLRMNPVYTLTREIDTTNNEVNDIRDNPLSKEKNYNYEDAIKMNLNGVYGISYEKKDTLET